MWFAHPLIYKLLPDLPRKHSRVLLFESKYLLDHGGRSHLLRNKQKNKNSQSERHLSCMLFVPSLYRQTDLDYYSFVNSDVCIRCHRDSCVIKVPACSTGKLSTEKVVLMRVDLFLYLM